MLKILYAKPHMVQWENRPVAEYPGDFFDIFYEREWFEDPLMVDILNNIEQIPVKEGSVLSDMAMAEVAPRMLSNGVKNLFLAKNYDDCFVLLSKMGENCFEYLVKIAETKDVYLCADIPFYLTPSDLGENTLFIINYGRYVSSILELIECNDRADEEVLRPNALW